MSRLDLVYAPVYARPAVDAGAERAVTGSGLIRVLGGYTFIPCSRAIRRET